MGERRFMIREYESGEVIERSVFPVGNATKTRKPKEKGSTPPRKQDQNARAAEKCLARNINCNFNQGDLWITLSYSESRLERLVDRIIQGSPDFTPETIRREAIRERDLFLRRVKREMQKQNIEFKYIASTSDMDGDTGEQVRIHHHIIVQKSAYDAVLKHWSREEAYIRPLRDQKDYTPIAIYIIKQVRRQPDQKKYTSSRNLAKPKIREKIILIRQELKAPRGAVVMHRGEYDYDSSTQYIRYVKPPEKMKRGGRRE